MRLPKRFPPPESNAYLILGIASTLLGLGHLYDITHPDKFNNGQSDTSYHHPTIFSSILYITIGILFLIPAIRRKIKKKT
jgi:hypothetical protein